MKNKLKRALKVSPYGIYEYFRDNRNNKLRDDKSDLIFKDYLSISDIKKLHIGCGDNFLDGWLNTDLNSSDRVGYLDAGKPFIFKDESFDFIFSEHLFEHLDVEQQINMLKESLRVLKGNGVLRIATPSLDFLNDLYNTPKIPENEFYINWAINRLPGLQPVKNKVNDVDVHQNYIINHFYKAWGHKMIHNYKSLESLALQIGFSEVKKGSVGVSEINELRKIERHGEVIPAEVNLLETMVVELRK